jgi:hypothetical protein
MLFQNLFRRIVASISSEMARLLLKVHLPEFRLTRFLQRGERKCEFRETSRMGVAQAED